MPITLHELGRMLTAGGATSVALDSPRLLLTSTNLSRHPACTDWLAELTLSPFGLESESAASGWVEFLTIRLGEMPIADMLSDASEEVELLVPLFAGSSLGYALREQFGSRPIDHVLVVLDVFVAEPVRGHRLGAWMVAEVAYRMLHSTNGLLLMAAARPDAVADSALRTHTVVERLGHYWTRAGLVRLLTNPAVLGQSSQASAMHDAREALQRVRSTTISATREALISGTSPLPSAWR